MAVPLLTPKHIAALVAYSIFKMAVNMADFMKNVYSYNLGYISYFNSKVMLWNTAQTRVASVKRRDCF
jgi:hypothetical protein